MGEVNKVVARFLDGSTLKGTTEDFSALRPSFHLHGVGETSSREIQCAKLKAVFFVKDLAGDPTRKDIPGFPPTSSVGQGKRISVQFRDGEILCGTTMAYSAERTGFFMAPADDQGNNIRVYVLKHAATKIAVGAPADALAQMAQARAA
ncbi:MAG: hypothetical protein IPJ04_07685 [Candidatus Eisenbacteria bacterium]|nr:hypothetical protein [Candidatus Eisenbacteria bacterium]